MPEQIEVLKMQVRNLANTLEDLLRKRSRMNIRDHEALTVINQKIDAIEDELCQASKELKLASKTK